MENSPSLEPITQSQSILQALPMVRKPSTNPWAILLFVILLATVGVGGYLVGTQSKNNLSNTVVISNPSPVKENQMATKPDWLAYRSDSFGLTIEYPNQLTKTEDSGFVQFLFGEKPVEGPGDDGLISIQSRDAYTTGMFKALYEASTGEDVPLAHGASDVVVEKVRNLSFGSYSAVEYSRDGISLFNRESGRGPIGYEHNFIVKINEGKYIILSNAAMDINTVKVNDAIFMEMISSLRLN